MVQSSPPKEHAGLRVIAVFKLFKAILLLIVGFGAFRLLNRDLTEVARLWAHRLTIDPENHFARWLIREAAAVEPNKLRHFGEMTLLFALDQMIEAVGLWFNQAWAKYLLGVATSLVLIHEVYLLFKEMANGVFSYWRLGAVAVTIAILVYLVIIFRLDRQRRTRKT